MPRQQLRSDDEILIVLRQAPSCAEAARLLGYERTNLRVRCSGPTLLGAYEACRARGEQLRGVKWRQAS